MSESESDTPTTGSSTATIESLTDHTRESTRINHASDLAPELLSIGVDIVDCVFVPGLSGIARRLLNIWRAVEQVRVNRNDALRLAGRCADILNCVKADINRNGARVPTALELPIRRLENTLDAILQCMRKHIRRALILQYLWKNSISKDISYCGSLLDDAMTLISFGLGLNFQQTSIEIVIHQVSRFGG